MGGGIANFTSVAGTFTGIVKASSLRHAAKHTHHHGCFRCTIDVVHPFKFGSGGTLTGALCRSARMQNSAHMVWCCL